jgi:signal recognition particle receptor subunit beta
MAFVNYNNKEITVKIVYYGPALSGKTTCLKYIYESGEYRKKGKLITLDTDGDRTLFFDFLPIEIGKLGDYSIKMQLYTVPGQVAYNTTRKLVLQGSDGIVFVADSQPVMRDQNMDSFNNLKENLKANNIAYEETPLIFQYNKRDLRDILPVDSLNRDLNPENKAFFPTIGTTGENVLEGLHTIMKIVIIHLKNKLSIFQKDKTVMFSRDEVTDSIAKKNAPPKKPDSEPVVITPMRTTQPPPKARPFIETADTHDEKEKDEIFELSSSLMEEPLKTRDYPRQQQGQIQQRRQEEDIFNLADESRLSSHDVSDLDIPEMSYSDELGSDDKATHVMELPQQLKHMQDKVQTRSKSGTMEEEIEEIGREYEIKAEDIKLEPLEEGFIPSTSVDPDTKSLLRAGVDLPIHIEVPEDKNEIRINVNLQIVIRRKK